MSIRETVYSPLQNAVVWLAAGLHGHEPADSVLGALTELFGPGQTLDDAAPLTDVLAFLRRCGAHETDAGLRLVLSGPGDAPRLPAGSPAAAAAAAGPGAVVVEGTDPTVYHALVPRVPGDGSPVVWERFSGPAPLPAPDYLSPGEADRLLTQATDRATDLIDAVGYRPNPKVKSPRLTVGTLGDFYDTPGLPESVPPRAAKLFARADRVAAIVETLTERIGDHSLDPQLLALGGPVRRARVAGVDYAVRELARG